MLRSTTARERQLWYWQQEMDSLCKEMNRHPEGSEQREEWKRRYDSAVRTYKELTEGGSK